MNVGVEFVNDNISIYAQPDSVERYSFSWPKGNSRKVPTLVWFRDDRDRNHIFTCGTLRRPQQPKLNTNDFGTIR